MRDSHLDSAGCRALCGLRVLVLQAPELWTDFNKQSWDKYSELNNNIVQWINVLLGVSFKFWGEKVQTVIKVKRPPQSTINCSKLLPAEFTVRTSTKCLCCFLVWDLTLWQQELPRAGMQQVFGTPAVLDGTPHLFPGQYLQAYCLQANVCVIYHILFVPQYNNVNSLNWGAYFTVQPAPCFVVFMLKMSLLNKTWSQLILSINTNCKKIAQILSLEETSMGP